MFRMTTFAFAAAAAIAATTAMPTTASAWHNGWRHDNSHYSWRYNDNDRHGWRYRHHDRSRFVVRFSAPYYAYAPRCYISRRWVDTHWGWRLRSVRVCR